MHLNYHISSVSITQAFGFPYSNAHMMDRNLGAINNTQASGVDALGLLYQWGRKDPFIGAKTMTGSDLADTYPADWPSAEATTEEKGTVGYTTKHPQTFITSSGDWMQTRTDDLWTTAKTIYDPCPSGWKVPNEVVWNEWNSFFSSTPLSYRNGYTFTSPLFSNPATWYPAAGVRVESSGDFERGTGNYWSCSTSESSARELQIAFENFEFLNANRAYGFSVRCVSE